MHLINPLEFCRGHISALSYRESDRAAAVHILALRKRFKDAGILKELGRSLYQMALLGEAQEIGGGYWYPTPLRKITVHSKCSIVISSNPTIELARHFPHLKPSDGLARVSHPTDLEEVPEQSLYNWLGAESQQDTLKWAVSTIQAAKNEMLPTGDPKGVQYFSYHRRKNAYTWSHRIQDAASIHDFILCQRDKRFFLGRRLRARLVTESQPIRDGLRLQYGIARLTGNPIHMVTVHNIKNFSISIPSLLLPRPEWKLLTALGRNERSVGCYLLISDEQSFLFVIKMMRNLGCIVKV